MTKRTRFAPRTVFTLVGMSVGVALLAIPSPLAPAFVWNFSISAPIGLYRIEQQVWRRGDRVAVQPDAALSAQLTRAGVLENGRLLIKRVAAMAGDEVCREGQQVVIDGMLAAIASSRTASGAALPAWSGCRRLRDGEVFLLGDGDRSFDGRYFGVTRALSIIGPVQPIWLSG